MRAQSPKNVKLMKIVKVDLNAVKTYAENLLLRKEKHAAPTRTVSLGFTVSIVFAKKDLNLEKPATLTISAMVIWYAIEVTSALK